MKNMKEIEGNRRKCASANRNVSSVSHVTTRQPSSCVAIQHHAFKCTCVTSLESQKTLGQALEGLCSKDFGAGTGRVVFDAQVAAVLQKE